MGIVSANTLFHFTSKLQYLVGILKSDFIPRYNLEELVLGNDSVRIGVPMVSFCDIPLSSISEHLDKYGQYALGMSMKWANKKKLNPVLYIKNNSTLSKQLWYLTREITVNPETDDLDLVSHLVEIMRYFKTFEGLFTFRTKGSKELNIKFYDEREWRYVPNHIKFRGMEVLLEENFAKLKDKSLPDYKLAFTPKDIKYLIVSTDKEISPLIKSIKDSERNYSYKDVELLHSRIMTIDQIKNDF